MEVLHPRCAGLDVHKGGVVAAVRIAAPGGGASVEVRRFETTTPGLPALGGWLAERGCTHAAMEATGVCWRPVRHVPSDGDLAPILANAAHVKDVPGRRTDVADAAWLAELLAHGPIRPSFVPEPATAAMRALMRTRKQLVREGASHVQRPQKVLEDADPSPPRCRATSSASAAAPSWRRRSPARPIPTGCSPPSIAGSRPSRGGCARR
jgi:transposase